MGTNLPAIFFNSIDGLEATTARTKGGSVRRRKIKGGWNPFDAGSWNDLGDKIVGGVNDAVNTVSNGVNGAVNTVVDGGSQVIGQIENTANDLAGKITDITKNMSIDAQNFFYRACTTTKDSVNQAFAEVAKTLPSEADAVAFGKQLASALIHQGIPQATAAICGALAEAAFPEGGPVSAQLGSQLGQMLGDKIADEVGNQTGYGLRRRHRGHLNLIPGGTLRHGVPSAHISEETRQRIMTHGLAFRHKGVNGLHKGGSFASPSGS